MTGPIKPKHVQELKNKTIPEKVFEVFNKLIVDNWSGNSCTIMQDEAANKVAAALGISRHEVFKNSYLDIEDAYQKAGWKVEYDKPGYNESYEASWSFRK